MPEKIRWGILGTGKIARVFASALNDARRGEKYGVASRTSETAESFASEHGFPESFGAYQALLDDPNVDAIYVSTPHTVHRECVLAAASAGKHILCEKPMGVTEAECLEMISAAETNGVILLEAFMYRCHPITIRLQQLLQEKIIGDIRTVRSSFTYGLAGAYNVRTDKQLRGGGLYDVGCYCINFSRMVAGEEPESIDYALTLGAETGVDENLGVTMKFPSGVIAQFDVGIRSAGTSFAEIVGSEGRIVLSNPWKPDAEEASFDVIKGNQTMAEVIANGGHIFTLEADHLAAVIAGEEEPLIPASNAIGNAAVLDTIWNRIHGG